MISMDLRRYETLGRLFVRFGSLPTVLQKRNASPRDVSDLLQTLIWLLSLLLKAESQARLHLVGSDSCGALLTVAPLPKIRFIKEYLEQFPSALFSFNRTERQTLVFILENVLEYQRQLDDKPETADGGTGFTQHFIDSRFWLENLFKMIDEKLTISLIHSANGDLILMDTDREIPLAPFIISTPEGTMLLQTVGPQGPLYRAIDDERCYLGGETEQQKLADFLMQNLSLSEMRNFFPSLKSTPGTLRASFPHVEAALEYYRENNWAQVLASLNRISDDLKVQAPLLLRLRIVTMLHLQHSGEALNEAKLFLSRFPAYSVMYEIIAEAYEQKKDISAALSAYERAAQFSRSHHLSGKIKELRQILAKDKMPEAEEESIEYLSPVTLTDEQKKTLVQRPELLSQMAEVLSSQHRPNLLVVGDGGAGKTNLIRQFVSQLALTPHWKALFPFREARIIQFVHLLTGSKYRGQFEEKVLALLNEAVKQKHLLVVEDIHLLFSQGGARGTALDFINIVRPFLQDKKLQIIATTHYEELKNTLERDSAFMGCFHQLTVRPLDDQATLEVLNQQITYQEEQGNGGFPRELLVEVMELSRQMIRTRSFPDAPLLLLDRVFAKMRIQGSRDEPAATPTTARQLLAETIREMANLPAHLFGISVQDRLAGLEDRMASRIIGQRKVLSRLTDRINAYKRGYKIRDSRPDGVFLLVGPTGVGKTETALVLADELLGNRDAILRIDMSEYMEKFTYSRFIGAAPGYVGYNDTNQLTDKVRQNPMTIILLDEIEKADPQLLNIFLQVFDAGRLTDARGRVVDFSSTVVLMTSNVGTELYGASPLGYQEQGRNTQVGESSLLKMIRKRFSPEFLNRLDDILVFNPLGDREARCIVDLQLEPIRRQLLRQGKELTVSQEVLENLAGRGISPQYGARQLTRVITELLLEPLARRAGEAGWPDCRRILCNWLGDGVEIMLQSGYDTVLTDAGKEPDPLSMEMERE